MIQYIWSHNDETSYELFDSCSHAIDDFVRSHDITAPTKIEVYKQDEYGNEAILDRVQIKRNTYTDGSPSPGLIIKSEIGGISHL